MKLLLVGLLTAAVSVSLGAQKKEARVVELVGTDNMKFDKTTIAAKPGETIRVVLKSVGKAPKTIMGHNFVLLKLGTNVDAFNQAAFNARATDFIPPDQKDKIIANTALVGPGETVEVTFTVPAKTGSYDYICSFPGHSAMGMKGKLVVK